MKKHIPHLIHIVLLFTAMALSGCGGGGGGGVTTVAPVETETPTTGSIPVQSAWSPGSPSDSTLSNLSSFPISFNTDIPAKCKWATSDLSYVSMTNYCSTSFSTGHSCSASGLSEGSASVYLACENQSGNSDSAASNTKLDFVIDTIAPAITITSPSNGSSHYNSSPPSISVNYSDSGTGVDPAQLEVFFNMQNIDVDLTERFGRDPIANSSGSETDSSFFNPMSRTGLSRYDSTNFTSPGTTWSIDRLSDNSQKFSFDGEETIYAWDTEGYNLFVIDIASGARKTVELSGKPVFVEGAPGAGSYFVAYENSKYLYKYNMIDNSFASNITLGDYPVILSYNPENGRLYTAYENDLEIGVYNCASGFLESAIPTVVNPDFLKAWPSSQGEVLLIGWQAQYRLFRLASDGTEIIKTDVGLGIPKGMAVSPEYNIAFATRYSESEVRAVNTSGGSFTDIAVGNSPRGVFTAGSKAMVINSGDGTISEISATSLITTGTLTTNTPTLDGLYINGDYYLLHDVWQLSSQVIVTITARIKDKAGNTAENTISITMEPEHPG
ncbi:MAG TPA: hypothetical protein PLN69_01515 [bacterium]|nr:hypothetical protein [bacterium]